MSADVHALAGAYALDALPADERAFFERHLSVCDACRAEVAELTETAARLGSAAAQTPPPGLRDRILAAADVTRQLPPERDSQEQSPLQAARAQRSWRERWLAPVAACLALTVVVLSGAVVSLARRAAPEADQAYVAVLGAPDLQTAELQMETDAGARFLYSPAQNRGVLVTANMPAVAEDETYELWLIHDDKPVAAGLFRPDDDGAALAAVDGIVKGAELVAVTVEPRRGSEQPTGAVLASAEL